MKENNNIRTRNKRWFILFVSISLLVAVAVRYYEEMRVVDREVEEYRYEHRIEEKGRALLTAVDWSKEGEEYILHLHTDENTSLDVSFHSVHWVNRENLSVVPLADHPHILYNKITLPALTLSSVSEPLRSRLTFFRWDNRWSEEEDSYSNVTLYVNEQEFLNYVAPLEKKYGVQLTADNHLLNEQEFLELKAIREREKEERLLKKREKQLSPSSPSLAPSTEIEGDM